LRALESSENTWPGNKILVMKTACVLTTQVAALVTAVAVRTLLLPLVNKRSKLAGLLELPGVYM